MAKTLMVGCKLPHGIVLHHPLDPEKKVELAGLNKIKIIGADHAVTEVDCDFMEQWLAVHKDFPAVKSGAIFAARSMTEIVAVAKEHAGRKTGFEQMPQEDKASGIKKADKD